MVLFPFPFHIIMTLTNLRFSRLQGVSHPKDKKLH